MVYVYNAMVVSSDYALLHIHALMQSQSSVCSYPTVPVDDKYMYVVLHLTSQNSYTKIFSVNAQMPKQPMHTILY